MVVGRLTWLGIALALTAWVIDATMHSLVLHNRSLVTELYAAEPLVMAMRVSLASLLVILGGYAQYTVTKCNRAEKTVRDQAAFLKSTLDALSHPFYVIDAEDYTIKIANTAARLGELSRARTCYELTHRQSEPCSGDEHTCPLREVKRTKAPVTVEHIHYDSSGNATIYEVHCHPVFDGEGNMKEVIESNEDITERKQAEESLRQAHTETVMLLAAAAEAHDRTTGLHLQSVRAVSEALAHELGYGEQEARELGVAAVLHDIGKIRVPDSVLASSGRLTKKEWELMQHHTTWGEEFLTGRPGLELATTIARSHHERWDGSGYPDGLAGEAIPEVAAIVAVADSLDAMTSDRAYRTILSLDEAFAVIVACSGTQLSPKVVAALARLYERDALPRKPVPASELEAAA